MIEMNFDDCDFDEISNLADIFPDIEPYLDEVTESFNEINRKRTYNTTTLDNSDSDSGIGGDSLNKSKSVKYVSITNQNQSGTNVQNEIPTINNQLYPKTTNGTFPTLQEFKTFPRITPIRIVRSDNQNPKTHFPKRENINISEREINFGTNTFYENNNNPFKSQFVPSQNNNLNTLINKESQSNEFLSKNYDNYSQSHHSLFNTQTDISGLIDAQQVDRLMKKQERMIKNRQAASLSRQRKKEYMERLENKVEQQRIDNQILQNQLSDAREKIFGLEQENVSIKNDLKLWRDRYYELEKRKMQYCSTSSNSKTKLDSDVTRKKILKTTATSTTLLGIFLLVAFNFQLFNSNTYLTNSIFTNSQKHSSIGRNEMKFHRLSRTLFSLTPSNSTENDDQKLSDSIICNKTKSMNNSETIRLSKELHSWSYRYKYEYNKILSTRNRFEHPFVKNEDVFYQKMFKDRKKKETKEFEVAERNRGYHYFFDVINDIGRNPDTLYFVSLHSDNWIYPAFSSRLKNNSNPKITLLLPAHSLSDSNNQFKMMKIDCDVRNFTVLNLNKRP